MKIKVKLRPCRSRVSIYDYFDSQTIYCLISLSNFTNNKEPFDRQIPQNLESCEVTREKRARLYLFEFENVLVMNVTLNKFSFFPVCIFRNCMPRFAQPFAKQALIFTCLQY